MEALDHSDRVIQLCLDFLCRPTTIVALAGLVIVAIFLSSIYAGVRSLWRGFYAVYSVKIGHVVLLTAAVLVAWTGVEGTKTFLVSLVDEWGVRERLAGLLERFVV